MKRKYLSGDEMQSLLQTVARNMTSYRDYCMISMAFHHGLRVSELISLKLEDYDSLSGRIYIHRLKGGFSSMHPLLPEEHTSLRCWIEERQQWRGQEQEWLFLSRHGKALSRQRFYQLLLHYSQQASLLPVHPHMLRHSCGFNLAERGNDTRLIQDYLGHRNIRHTVLYTAANPARFMNAWTRPPLSQSTPCAENAPEIL